MEMSSNVEGQAAIESLNGKEMKGRALNVNEARPRSENRGDRGGYGGRRGGRSGKAGYGGGRGAGGFNKGGYGGGRGR